MAGNKNNNVLYTSLAIAGVLLLIIPFFIFNIGDSINGTGHLARFGLHILAFAAALLAGSMVSTGVTNAAASSIAMKVAAISTAAIVSTGVVYNTVQYASSNQEYIDTTQVTSPSLTAATSIDSLTQTNTDSINDSSTPSVSMTEEYTNTSSDNNALKSSSTTSASIKTNENTIPDKNTKTASTTILDEVCNSFQVLHGSSQLDRKLGLSVYDPNKTIRFNNECGCILKDATMSLTRANKVTEQKNQNGNFISLHTFKDLQAGDKLSVEIKQATCKDQAGVSFLYTFPKPILTVVLISDHREFETTTQKNNVTSREAIGVIGAYVEIDKQKKLPIIKTVYPNQAGSKAGLKAGVYILKVDNIETTNKSLKEVTDLVQGKVGSKVSLLLSDNRTVTIIREAAKSTPTEQTTPAKKDVVEEEMNKYGN